MRTLAHRRARLVAAALLTAGGMAALPAAMSPAAAAPAAHAATAPAPVTVTVNPKAALATVPSTGLGVNDAVWDSQLGTTGVSDLLKTAGVQMIRYPGGSYGDIYHWQDNTAPGGYVAPDTDFDTFMGSVQRVGAQPIIIANYGTGSPTEAADWVRYANVTKEYGAKYWEIGNELYGNGYYGSAWEADNHADKSPAGYANEVVAYADAMKAVDPTIKVGAVLTMPGGWPDSVVAAGDSAAWNQTVLSIAGSKIDFVILHWYPGGSGAADALTKPVQLDDAVYLVRQQIARYAGANAANLGIALTETNVGYGQNTQPGALFAANTYADLWEDGVFTVDWWDVHNGAGTVSTVAGQTDYGDFGLLSSATCASDGTTCEPPMNTPFAPYYALRVLSTFAHPGDQLVRAATDQPLVDAHAVRRANGDLAVMLVNKDPDNSYPVDLGYAGYTPAAGAPTVYSFANGGNAITTAQTGSATEQTLPPYSLTVLVLHPSSVARGVPGAPGAPRAGAVTDRDATITWPAATAGSHPIAKYEVYWQNGATSEEFGETPGTSFTVHNLMPGTRYTVNVVTRDTAGNVSWSSPPLEFTTGTPAASACAVHFVDTSDWASGYVASVDVTNTGPSPISGWTLRFTWPTEWQSVSSGWNGTWTQTGTTVTVTSLDTDAALAANGGTTNIGFVSAYNGPDVPPAVFTLNGTVCTST
ncbi:cellulose binding domain-containing protein [Rugosimonospora acidiphila]|uniref:Cellulose binding domain-containing protein n=1 Tax=Rugosimonospora acidiphila TaxID=556531 RepID=A0ABP9SH42_9ACTN